MPLVADGGSAVVDRAPFPVYSVSSAVPIMHPPLLHAALQSKVAAFAVV